ncbi:MAG TPA: hypothetical protein VNO81_13125 [Candidatus Nitrosotenuis sp.]|jgi:hypothetical protein|nr:hypothetical protein [Candidatus Nitrosotenuis sp.]
MALSVSQAVQHYLDELAGGHPDERVRRARCALEILDSLPSRAFAGRPTRANPRFARPGAGGTVAQAMVYELGPADLGQVRDPEIRQELGCFAEWLWNQGLLEGQTYQDLREALELAPDPRVRRRTLEHRLMQRARQDSQHLQEHLMNPVLYLGLSETPFEQPRPVAELEGELEIERVEQDSLWGRLAGRRVGPLEVGSEAARLARPGDRLQVVLGRLGERWSLLDVRPSFEL